MSASTFPRVPNIEIKGKEKEKNRNIQVNDPRQFDALVYLSGMSINRRVGCFSACCGDHFKHHSWCGFNPTGLESEVKPRVGQLSESARVNVKLSWSRSVVNSTRAGQSILGYGNRLCYPPTLTYSAISKSPPARYFDTGTL